MADESDEVVAPAPSKMPMIIGMVVALLAGAGGGFFASGMTGGGEGEETAEGEEGEGSTSTIPTVVSLEPFNVNLRNSSRLLRVEVQLEVQEKDAEGITGQTAKLRDGVLTLASDFTSTELEGLNGKNRFRDELLGRLNAVLEDGQIQRIYFTQFVIQ